VPGRSASENEQKDIYLHRRRGEAETITGAIFAQDVLKTARKSYKKRLITLITQKAEKCMPDCKTP